MRLKRSIINTMTGMLFQLVVLSISLVTRKIFLSVFGLEVLGIHGYLSNIMSWLSLADLGIGNTICYAMYKPLAHNDWSEIKSLHKLLARIFRVISFIYILIVAALIPFVLFSNHGVLEMHTIIAVFCIWSLNQLCTLYTYFKTIILVADQKIYKIKILTTVIYLLQSLTQILVLLYLRSYVVYTLVLAIFTGIQCIYQIRLEKKEYPLQEVQEVPLQRDRKKELFHKTYALFFHGLSDTIFFSTDNIVVVNLLGAALAGIYSNYQLIFNTLSQLLNQVVSGSISSVGNYLVLETKEKSFQMFLVISFLSNILFGILSVCAFLLADKFIFLFFKDALYLDSTVLLLMSFNLLILGFRCGAQIFRGSAALYQKDMIIRFVFALMNLSLSILFGKFIGMVGIILATTIILTVEELIVLPLYVLKAQLFNFSFIRYYINIFIVIIAYIISIVSGRFVVEKFLRGTGVINFFLSGTIILIMTTAIFSLLVWRVPEALTIKSFLRSCVTNKINQWRI